MTTRDYGYFTFLALLAAFIWLRDLAWVDTIDDTLPILVSIPLFIWLEWPWKLKGDSFEISAPLAYIAMGSLLLGIISGFILPMSLAWCILLWAWISRRVDESYRGRLSRLMILPLMAFPWVTIDCHTVGWWFRLSGAWATGQILSIMQFEVLHQGTQLVVNQVPISVDVSCAGLNTLQSMLIAGSVLAYIQLGEQRAYWYNLPLLVAIAWVANTVRITTLALAALLISPEFAMGSFHDAGGWMVLVIMFGLCWGLFWLQQPRSSPNTGAPS